MDSHTQLMLAIDISIFFGLCTLGFFIWLAWGLCWDLYDYLRQRRTRIAKFDARVGRDVYRDVKGLTK
jgi:hypothetical protein